MTKKIKTLLLLSFIAISTMSCDKENEEYQEDVMGTLVQEAENTEIINNFFNSALPYSSYYHYSDCFFCTLDEFERNIIYVINSDEELKNACKGISNNALPSIDFSKYTLIIGQERPQPGFKPKDQLKKSLYETEDGYILSLQYDQVVMKPGSVDLFIDYIVYYWGIYPKLKNNNIIVKLKIEN